MRKPLLVLITATALAMPLFAQQQGGRVALPPPPAAAPPVPVKAKPIVEIAILLDTSNSMDGLIAQAKSQLWKIVNEFAKAQRDGQHPDIHVALYQYGTPSLGAETNFIKQLVPLTDDLDKVSEELFKVTTNGGDEYCGAVIRKAAQELSWSTDKSAYKAIFIAGNEPFTQGPIDFHLACREAIAKGIIVNTIYCGSAQEGIATNWQDGAKLADGSFLSINQDAPVAVIAAPQDKELADLGAKINKTYIGYGRGGRGGAANQMAQDANAAGPSASPSGAAAERTLTKATANYKNATWDLVDAVNEKRIDLKDLKPEDMPEEMQKLDQKGREAYVAAKLKERADIQARIQQLGTERAKFLAEKQKEQSPGNTLDAAIITVVQDQAKNNGMSFPTK